MGEPPGQSPDASGRRAPRWGIDTVFLSVVTAGLLLARIPVAAARYFDPDEFEHSHAAWCVFKGMLPYKDFFEHHTPWYYYLLAPFFRWFAVDQSFDGARRFLLFARGSSLVLDAISVILVALLGGLGTGANRRRVGLLAGLLLAAAPVFIEKTLEIRPDVLALPFFIGALGLLSRGLLEPEEAARRRLRWFVGGGLSLGAAIMCTQKMLFVLPGALTALGLWTLAGPPRRKWQRALAVMAMLGGVALPCLLTWTAFAAKGGGWAFLHNNFLMNVKWRLRSGRHVGEVLETAWPVAALALLGIAVALHRFRREPRRHHGELLLIGTLGGLLAGIAVMPVPFLQYYLMPLAVTCVLAAEGLHFLVNLTPHRVRPWLLVGVTLPLLLFPVADLRQAVTRRDPRQLARLRYVLDHTAPEDTVMDGWLGTGVFRPHAFHYFFMHPELRAMLSPEDIDGYVKALETGKSRPALVALDHDLIGLGPRFLAFVRRNLVTTDGLFYRPTRAHPEVGTERSRFPACPPAGRAVTPTDPGAFRAAITRQWTSCHHTFVGGENDDALGTQGDGLEIKPDGRYWHLSRDGAGKLIGVPGVASEGSISYGVTAFGAVQTTFQSDADQTLVAAPVLTADPPLLIIRTGSADHRYIAN